MPRDWEPLIWEADPELKAEADKLREEAAEKAVSLDDFFGYMPAHNYI
ncbi:MAG TPA: hypothetical protein VEK82_06460 [Stellaceae bacterium]|nr:hypothetical protein [Stellaceae bacterium]